MMDLLAALEGTAFSSWLREASTIWAYPTVLTLHTVGLALLVGANWALDLRLLGFASDIPLTMLARSFRVMWVGFWLNAISGVMLFAADATTKGATRLFVAKLGLVAAGVVVIVLMKRSIYGDADRAPSAGPAARVLAVVSLVVWIVAIAAGRLMAYV
jgi:uncharacterized protein DUF6644